MNTLADKLFQLLVDEHIIDRKDIFKYKTIKRFSAKQLLELLNKDIHTKYIIENNTYLVNPDTGNKITIGKPQMNLSALDDMDYSNNTDCFDCQFIEDCEGCVDCFSIRNGMNVVGVSHFVF
jgi:hypothetical protein